MWRDRNKNRNNRHNSRRSRSPKRSPRRSPRREKFPNRSSRRHGFKNNVSSQRRDYKRSISPKNESYRMPSNRSPKKSPFNERYYPQTTHTQPSEIKTSGKQSPNEYQSSINKNQPNYNTIKPHNIVQPDTSTLPLKLSSIDDSRKVELKNDNVIQRPLPLGPVGLDRKIILTGQPMLSTPLGSSLSAGCKFLSGTTSLSEKCKILDPVIPAPKTILNPMLSDTKYMEYQNNYSADKPVSYQKDKVKQSKYEESSPYSKTLIDELNTLASTQDKYLGQSKSSSSSTKVDLEQVKKTEQQKYSQKFVAGNNLDNSEFRVSKQQKGRRHEPKTEKYYQDRHNSKKHIVDKGKPKYDKYKEKSGKATIAKDKSYKPNQQKSTSPGLKEKITSQHYSVNESELNGRSTKQHHSTTPKSNETYSKINKDNKIFELDNSLSNSNVQMLSNSSYEYNFNSDYSHRNSITKLTNAQKDTTIPSAKLSQPIQSYDSKTLNDFVSSDFKPEDSYNSNYADLSLKDNTTEYIPSYLRNYTSGSMLFNYPAMSNFPDISLRKSSLFPTPFTNKQFDNDDDDLPCFSWVGELLDKDEDNNNEVGTNENKNEKTDLKNNDSSPEITQSFDSKHGGGNLENKLLNMGYFDALKNTSPSVSMIVNAHSDGDLKTPKLSDNNLKKPKNTGTSIMLDQEYYVSKKVLENYEDISNQNKQEDATVKQIPISVPAKPKKSILKNSSKKVVPLRENNSFTTTESQPISVEPFIQTSKPEKEKYSVSLEIKKKRPQFSRNFEDSLSAEMRENLLKANEEAQTKSDPILPEVLSDVNAVQDMEKISKYASGWKKAMSQKIKNETSHNNKGIGHHQEHARFNNNNKHQNVEPLPKRKVIDTRQHVATITKKIKMEIPDKREVKIQNKLPQQRTFLLRGSEKITVQKPSENTRLVIPVSRSLDSQQNQERKETRNTWDSLLQLQQHVSGEKNDLKSSSFDFWGKHYVDWFAKNVLHTSQFQDYVKTSTVFKGISDLTEIPILFLRSLSEGDKLAKRCVPKNSSEAKELLQYVEKFRLVKQEVRGLCNELGLQKTASGKILLPNQDKISPNFKEEFKPNAPPTRPKIIKIKRENYQQLAQTKTLTQNLIKQIKIEAAPIPVVISGGVVPQKITKNAGNLFPTHGSENLQITRTVNQNEATISTRVGLESTVEVAAEVESKFDNFDLSQTFVISNDKKGINHNQSSPSTSVAAVEATEDIYGKTEDLEEEMGQRSSTPPRRVIARSRDRSNSVRGQGSISEGQSSILRGQNLFRGQRRMSEGQSTTPSDHGSGVQGSLPRGHGSVSEQWSTGEQRSMPMGQSSFRGNGSTSRGRRSVPEGGRSTSKGTKPNPRDHKSTPTNRRLSSGSRSNYQNSISEKGSTSPNHPTGGSKGHSSRSPEGKTTRTSKNSKSSNREDQQLKDEGQIEFFVIDKIGTIKRSANQHETTSPKKQKLSTSSNNSKQTRRSPLITKEKEQVILTANTNKHKKRLPHGRNTKALATNKKQLNIHEADKNNKLNLSAQTECAKPKIKPIKFGIKRKENVMLKQNKDEIQFGAKKKVLVLDRQTKSAPLLTRALKTKVKEFKLFMKDIVMQNPLNYLYDIDLYDAEAIDNIIEKSLQFNKKFIGQKYTKDHALMILRQLFQDKYVRDTIKADIIERIESRGDKWKSVNWKTFVNFQKQALEITQSSNLNSKKNYNQFSDVELNKITQKLDLLFPQYHGDAINFVKLWAWKNSAKNIMNSLGQGTCKGLPTLPKINQNQAGVEKLHSWLPRVYNCPPYDTPRNRNARLLSAIISQLEGLNPDWIVTNVSDWWSKGYYCSRYHEIEQNEVKRNEATNINLDGMVILDEDFSDENDSISHELDSLENTNHEHEYSEDGTGAPTIFLY